jgi:uncharacterized protein
LNLARLPIRVRDGTIHPAFLGEADHGWLAELVLVASGRVGAAWCELQGTLRRPVMDGVSVERQGLAAVVLSRRLRRRVQAARPPSEVRAVVFGLAAGARSRDAVIATAAEELGIDTGEVEQALFADLPSERIVVSRGVFPTPRELAVEANLEMCRSLLMRAMEVEIQVAGNAHALVRRAQRGGLLSTLLSSAPDSVHLRMSGPLQLFRRTTRYGHALGGLLPALGRCDRFDLLATIAVGERELELRLRTGDPFLPADTDAKGGRSVDLARLLESDDWVAVPEPDPIGIGERLLFPDVELVSRCSRDRWLIERVGFWTPRYLEEKRAAYAAAGVARVILCVDRRLQCAEGGVAAGAGIVFDDGRVVAEEVWRVIGA